MCGIVGAISKRNVVPSLINGLKRLEYRGYDSAGMVVITDQQLIKNRVKGKVRLLEELVRDKDLEATIGIAHTRWATHGKPSERNAHPHTSANEIAVVHNGIIENHEALRQRLKEVGYEFRSDTDTETIVHLTHFYSKQEPDFRLAIQKAVKELAGAYALGIINLHQADTLYAVRCGSPLVVGLGLKENFIASDALALIPITNRFIYLQEGDVAVINVDNCKVFDVNENPVERAIKISELDVDKVEKGEFRHYMLKEIHEQPQAISNTLEERIYKGHVLENSFGVKTKEIFDQTQQVKIVACGTSYHAGCVARYWIEQLAGIPCEVEIASEFRYRNSVVAPNSLFITISQSGETADTLAALRLAKEKGYIATLAICNVPESSLVREADLVMMTRAGVEIGVASTKAFTTQLTVLLLLTLVLAKRHGLSANKEEEIVTALTQLPQQYAKILQQEYVIQELANEFADKQHALFLGRGSQYPVAMEGALKLKEISYIHAEAYPAGELKHGPLALVDKDMPVIAVAPNDELIEKLKSNLKEVQARGGKLYIFANENAHFGEANDEKIVKMPDTNQVLAPFIYTLSLQLLAYHVAVIRGTDVDQPRNLAKSVTVE
ncbi:MAG: glutamine--fructose-6-phosphate transaminase (isomerizing) [Pseudomonadota bacterium]